MSETLKSLSRKPMSQQYMMDLAWEMLNRAKGLNAKAVTITIRYEDGKSATYEARAPEQTAPWDEANSE